MQARDIHFAVTYRTAPDQETIVRTEQPDQNAWERYAHKLGIPHDAAPSLAMTYRTWSALRYAGDTSDRFEAWERTVAHIRPCLADGSDIAVRDGRPMTQAEAAEYDAGRAAGDDEPDPDPTRPVPAAGY